MIRDVLKNSTLLELIGDFIGAASIFATGYAFLWIGPIITDLIK